MTRKCLMIETKDRRRFFTHQRNYDQLVEFGKTFGAELSVVRVEKPEILDLVSLAPALCDTSYEVVNKPVFEVVEVRLQRTQRERKSLLRQASTVKRWVKKQLLEGEVVQLKDVSRRYKRYGLSLQAFCNHLADVKKELVKDGHNIVRIGHGAYQVQDQNSEQAK